MRRDSVQFQFRLSKALYRWEFEKGRKSLTVSPEGPASFDDPDLVIQAVLDNVGIGTAMENSLKSLIAEGRLVQVLQDWCPSFPGYFSTIPAVGISLPRWPRLSTRFAWTRFQRFERAESTWHQTSDEMPAELFDGVFQCAHHAGDRR
jgi:DNA-binding transcriptional LysR family regulator